MNRFLVSFAVGVAWLAGGTSAMAQEPYPGLIRDALALNYAPPCSLCHAKGNTGSGTVVTPFGWAMRGKGLEADAPDSVATALEALQKAKTDSDGDRVDDVAELVAGTDPNSPGAVPLPNGEQTGYGCGGTAPDPNRRGEGGFPPIALAVLLVLRRLGRPAASSGGGRR